jgi:hypothetical protein
VEWRVGDLIDVCKEADADGIVFTANAVIQNKNNAPELVMGFGAAKRIGDYFPNVASLLAKEIKQEETRIQPDYYLAGLKFKNNKKETPFYVFALQVKRDFKDKGDIELTIQSLKQLANWCKENPEIHLVLNCPLIGAGGFSHQKEIIFDIVEKELESLNIIVTTL